MIKLPEGELRDYLPAGMKNEVDMICLSYAVKKETEQLVKYRKAIMIYHFIENVPEPILDLLAVELRSLYYSDTLPIETKREIVKNTLRWHMQAGTPGAVREMIKVVFQEGDIVEWPDFSEPPYTPGTFDIVTKAVLTPDILGRFASMIDRVKNVRSHLRKLSIKRETALPIYFGAGCCGYEKPAGITERYCVARACGQTVYAGMIWHGYMIQPAIKEYFHAHAAISHMSHAGIYAAVQTMYPAAIREEGLYAAAI